MRIEWALGLLFLQSSRRSNILLSANAKSSDIWGFSFLPQSMSLARGLGVSCDTFQLLLRDKTETHRVNTDYVVTGQPAKETQTAKPLLTKIED